MTAAFPLQWPEGWPVTPPGRRGSNPNLRTASFDRARKTIMRELDLLGSRSVVLSTNVPLRQDGLPYADAARRRMESPGVAVYFQLRGKPMAMARDAYTDIAQNLRSLALAIEHLRGLERHGGGVMMERAFAGFTMLEAPPGWREVLNFTHGNIETAEASYRALAKQHHPDMSNGNKDKFVAIQRAIEEARREIG